MEFALRVRPEVLGARLRNARTIARLTQEAAAKALGVARTTIVAIEAGKRQITAEELRAFAELYRASESELLSGTRQSLDMDVKFRSAGAVGEHEVEQMAVGALLNRLASSTLELEELLNTRAPKLDFPTIDVNPDVPVDQQAEDAASALRQRLGVGLGPIPDLTALMESDLGIRVFERPLPSKVSGAVAFDESYGAFVLLNSNHPATRRRQTAGHEICHPLLRKTGLAVLFEDDDFNEKEDKFCDAFGRALLMPAATVRRKVSDLRALAGTFTVRHVLMMAIYFCVSIEAMTRRLEYLGLVPKGQFDSLKERGLGTRHLEEVRKEVGGELESSRFTPRSLLLAGVAFDRELMSEQQIAKKLELDLVTVRKVLAEVSESGDAGFDPAT